MKTLKEKINSDFMVAFKNKEMDKKNFLGLIKGEIQLQEGRGVESTDENILIVLKKLEKSLSQNGDENSKLLTLIIFSDHRSKNCSKSLSKFSSVILSLPFKVFNFTSGDPDGRLFFLAVEIEYMFGRTVSL